MEESGALQMYMKDVLVFLRREALDYPNISDVINCASNILQDVFEIFPEQSDEEILELDAISLAYFVIQRPIAKRLNVPPQQNPRPSTIEEPVAGSSGLPKVVKKDDLSYTTALERLLAFATRLFNCLPSPPIRFSDPVTEIERQALTANKIANSLMLQQRFDESISNYDRAIQLFPNESVYYVNRACTYYYSRQFYKCVHDCTTAISLESKMAKAYVLLGMTYVILKDHIRARQNFVNALHVEVKQEFRETFEKSLRFIIQKMEFLGELTPQEQGDIGDSDDD